MEVFPQEKASSPDARIAWRGAIHLTEKNDVNTETDVGRTLRRRRGGGIGRCLASVVTTTGESTATAQVLLPNGKGGSYTADVSLTFNNPQALSANCLNVTADVLDANGQADVDNRLPSKALAVDPAFPVRVTISPLASCGFSFDNGVAVELHANNLSYSPASPYRLYKAPVAGAFKDITSSIAAGSVRGRGRTGSFSEFVIVKDAAPNYSANANSAYDALHAELASSPIGATANTALSGDLAASRSAFDAGDYAAAIGFLATFDADVASRAGSLIPNRWSAAAPTTENVAGQLDSLSKVAQFYLGRLNGAP